MKTAKPKQQINPYRERKDREQRYEEKEPVEISGFQKCGGGRRIVRKSLENR